ncbi:hypothetical protein [Paenibacillus sp. GYB003]
MNKAERFWDNRNVIGKPQTSQRLEDAAAQTSAVHDKTGLALS